MENNQKQQKSYNIGLDIGTSSVGWAVTDEKFNIIKKGNKRKPLWGVLLFDEAETAEERRKYRSIRRNYVRRRERINLLQSIFNDEINKVDKNFFTKLNESFYIEQDIENKTIVLTDIEKEEMKNYQNKYKTIYHLRQALETKQQQFDIRLVYLAIHHIIKYRGNFNYHNFQIDNIDIKPTINNIINLMYEKANNVFIVDYIDSTLLNINELEKLLFSFNIKEKKKDLENIFGNIFVKKVSKEVVNALLGYTINLENLFLIDIENTKKIDFKAVDAEEKIENLKTEIGDLTDIILNLKKIYETIELKSIFKDEETCNISNLMVKYYDIHKNDLKSLKEVLKPFKKEYKSVFNDKKTTSKEELCLYTKYIRNQISYNEFKTEILKKLEKITTFSNEPKIKEIIERLDNQKFLPRITDTSNSIYPYQLNESELKTIINNQSIYYPFLKEEIDGELKLVKLLKFRIPYYVGPLVDENKSKFAWMERKEKGKITPFNFEKMVDRKLSAKNFILKLIGNCSYLLNEKVMPTNSIFYSRFKVFNELKQIKINDQSIKDNISFVHEIYEEFFLKTTGSLTNSKFQNYLRTKDELSMYVTKDSAEIKITGYGGDNKFLNTMASYIDFFGPNGIFKDTNLTEEDADKIIELITIFEDKEILKEEILELYPCLNDKINMIISKNYNGWSNLSKELLITKYYEDEETKIKKSIMDLMYETNENFMQILNNKKYNFWEMINQRNSNKEIKLDYSIVENLATSPAIKKGIWQSLKVVNEIISYMGYQPQNIIIEMARGEGEKGRKDNRKKQLENLYEKAKSEINDYNKLMNELKNQEKIDKEKMFLYFLQEGKSLYSRTPLDITNLSNYEIDHILPQTLIKDDSIDNKALVLKEENQSKRANLVLPSEFRKDSMKEWWHHLRKINLISQKKYNNLIRDNFRDKDIEGFINRQLVETRQITKHIANIMKNLYKDTNIIYFKAEISHNYRERFELYKYRDLNDYHHAHDAYLASVLGIYQNKYLKTKIDKEELQNLINALIKEKKYNELRYGYIINSLDQDFIKIDDKTGEVALNIKDFTETIAKNLYRNDILVTKKTEIKTGKFYKETKNKKGLAGIPLKKNLKTEWYGSYTGLIPSYLVVVKYEKNDKIEQALIGIPIYTSKQQDADAIKNYLKNLLNVEDVNTISIVKDKIPFNTIINIDGQICSIVGARKDIIEVCNAKEFNMEKEKQVKWKETLNRLFNKKNRGISNINYNNQLDELLVYVIRKIEKEYKLYNNLLPTLNEYINKNTLLNMEIETKENILLQLFNLLKFNSTTANLKIINGSSAFGRKIMKIKNGILIKKSSIGLKEFKDEF